MTFADLNMDLTQKKLYIKAVGLLMNYQTPFTVCRSHSWFSRPEGKGSATGGDGGGTRPTQPKCWVGYSVFCPPQKSVQISTIVIQTNVLQILSL